mgnify:CR=1 FL=1
MLPFKTQIQPDKPVYEQVVFAVRKAVVTGQLREGDSFPSVRQLSKELRINPNTAHKIIACLTREGLLQVRPGLGTVVQIPPASTAPDRSALLKKEMEQLVVKAKELSLSLNQLVKALEKQWKNL